ncbi:MAG TPA: Ig-like domain-containing protein, partial [Solirubrobacteraceae bacterium]
MTNTDSNTVVGFVSKTWNSFGEFVVTTTPSDYLSVQVTDGAQTSITALNGQNASFPLVGGIEGFASNGPNLGSGSFNYSYLGGTTATAPGATPQNGANSFTDINGIPEDIESSIWTDGPGAQMIPQWINTDSSQAPTHLMDTTGILVVTGDTSDFVSTFGPASNVKLNLVPTAVQSGPCATTTTLAAPTPAAAGTPVTFTATVTTSPLADGPPTGTVGFASDGTTIAGCHGQPLTGSGPYTATCTTTFPTAAGSPHSIVATFFADTNDQGSASPPISQVITAATTTTTLSASPPSPSVFGQPVTFTASVTPGDGDGTVAFTDGTTTLSGCGAKTLTGSGPYTATCTTSTLAVGSHSIVATYSGDTNFTGSGSTALAYTVNKAATTTTVTAAPASPSTFGQAVTLTATVAPVAPGAGSPTGTVTFKVDGTTVGTVPVSGSGQASISTSSLSAGSHTILATYSGDGNFLGSSGSLSYTVTCAVTITGNHSGALEVTSSTCVKPGGSVSGPIIVHGGASLDLEGAIVNGSVSSTGGSGAIRICGSRISGSVDIKSQTALVIVGDPGDAACAPNTIGGTLILQNNTGGVEAIN